MDKNWQDWLDECVAAETEGRVAQCDVCRRKFVYSSVVDAADGPHYCGNACIRSAEYGRLTEVVVRTRPEDTGADQVVVRLPPGLSASEAHAYALERIRGGEVLEIR